MSIFTKLKISTLLLSSLFFILIEVFVRRFLSAGDYDRERYFLAKIGLYTCAVTAVILNAYIKKIGKQEIFTRENIRNIFWTSADSKTKIVIVVFFIFSIFMGVSFGSLISLIVDR